MKINVPIREKKEFVLDNGVTIERWQRVSSQEFEVDPQKVSEEDKKEIENAPESFWWGIVQLPIPGPDGKPVSSTPFHFQIDGNSIEEVAGKFEKSLEAALAEMQERQKKEQNKIQPASPEDLQALNNAAVMAGGFDPKK